MHHLGREKNVAPTFTPHGLRVIDLEELHLLKGPREHSMKVKGGEINATWNANKIS